MWKAEPEAAARGTVPLGAKAVRTGWQPTRMAEEEPGTREEHRSGETEPEQGQGPWEGEGEGWTSGHRDQWEEGEGQQPVPAAEGTER